MRTPHLLIFFALLAAPTLVGCGDKDEDDTSTAEEADADTDTDTDSDTDSDTDTGASAGTVTVSVTAAGAKDKILVAMAWVDDPSSSGPVAAVCSSIGSDKETISGTLSEITGEDPCSLGEAFVFEPGEYPVVAGSFVPGSMTPSLCSAPTTVTVDGDTTIDLGSLGPCAE